MAREVRHSQDLKLQFSFHSYFIIDIVMFYHDYRLHNLFIFFSLYVIKKSIFFSIKISLN